MIVANPPYIPSEVIPTLPVEVERFEPHLALDGGPDGMRVLRRIISQAGSFLRPGAWLVMEIGMHLGRQYLMRCGATWQWSRFAAISIHGCAS